MKLITFLSAALLTSALTLTAHSASSSREKVCMAQDFCSTCRANGSGYQCRVTGGVPAGGGAPVCTCECLKRGGAQILTRNNCLSDR